MKKAICLLLSFVLSFGMFTGCAPTGNGSYNGNSAADSNNNNDISFDNSEVIEDINAVYSADKCIGVEEIEVLKHSKGDFSFRVWRVFDENNTDIYWLACRFKNDRLIGFVKNQLTGLNDIYENCDKEDFEFLADDDLSLIKIRSSASSSVFSYEFYHNGFSIQDYADASQSLQPDEYVEYEIQQFYTAAKTVNGNIDASLRKEYEDLIYSYINSGEIELDPDHSHNKEYKNYYSAEVINFYEDDTVLLINYIMRCPETSLGLIQTSKFTKDGGELVYSGSNAVRGDYNVPNKDETFAFYPGGRFERGWEQEMFLYNTKTETGQNLGLVHDTNYSFDYGFMSNGDAYIMNYEEFRTYNLSSGTAVQNFTTKTNFSAGGVIKDDGTKRYLLAIRRDPEKLDYIVIYGEYIEDEDYNASHPNDLQLAYNYKVGLLDKDGNLTKSWDTGVPIIFSAFGFGEVSMFKSGENEIEFFVSYKSKDNEYLRGRFNIETGVYTPIKEFKMQ